MANLKFSSDIIDDVLFRAGEPTDGTSEYQAQVVTYLNRAYRDIWMGGGAFVADMNEPWLWLKKDPPGTLILLPIVTGNVTVTNNNSAIAFSVAPADSMVGRFFSVDGFPDVFRIIAHTGGQVSATLDSVYTGPTASGVAYTVRKLEYDLPADFLRLIAPMRAYYSMSNSEVEGIDLPSLDQLYPLHRVVTGVPDQFALVTETKVRFNKAGGTTSTELIRIEFDYHQKPADLVDSGADEPLVPLQHRPVLADATLFYLLTDKSDGKAADIGVQTKAGLQAMQADNRARVGQTNRHRGHLYARPRVRTTKVVLRTSTGFIIG